MSQVVVPDNGIEGLKMAQLQPHSSCCLKYSLSSISSAVTTGSTMAKDLESFLHNGNCVPPPSPVATRFNPTLFFQDLDELNNKVIISGNPFEAYLPVPFEEEVAADFVNTSEDAYTNCKGKLKQLVSAFRARMHRISFHCHFGDCIDLCLWKDELKKKFQVIHCSFRISSRLGMTNLISSTSGCLANLDSVLLTNMNLSYIQIAWKSSLLEYIECTLRCPLSMVPTLYGMRLTNHLQLGAPSPVKLHEDIAKDQFVKLKWQNVPDFTGNFKLDLSPVLRSAIDKLAASRFLFGDSPCSFADFQLNTFYHILHSLSRRCELLPNGTTMQSLFQADVAPVARLTFRTEQAWKNKYEKGIRNFLEI